MSAVASPTANAIFFAPSASFSIPVDDALGRGFIFRIGRRSVPPPEQLLQEACVPKKAQLLAGNAGALNDNEMNGATLDTPADNTS